MEYKTNKIGLSALALGHLTVDMQTSSLAVMIPFLYATFKLDYGAAALIITLNSLTSSFIQPLFGILSDKKPLAWLLPLGCVMAAVGMVLVLFMPDYWLVLLAVIFSGLGSAAYHPEGSRNANYVSGPNKATGVSFFFVGGNLGFTLGPIYLTFMVAIFGTPGALALLIPGAIGFIALLRLQPLLSRYRAAAVARQIGKKKARVIVSNGQSVRVTMSILMGVISLRSVIQTGMVAFIPLYFINQEGGKEYGAFLLSAFLFAGAVGTLLGGRLADLLGTRTIMIGSMLITFATLLLFLNSSGFIQVISLAIAGAALISASSLTVVLAQAAMPDNIGLASGLTLGLGFGAGGIGAAALGKYADFAGLGQTMFVIALLPLGVMLLSWLLRPERKEPQVISPEQVSASV
ncbi:MFS transporter [Candidatus Chlorohelix sp.]|uniref:MFS transporter n=1 Tax=Candidatus Chlorohelix sp. TaxID=3139201 RepID=UPI0030751066